MISIGKPYLDGNDSHAYLKANVDISSGASSAWIEHSKIVGSSWRLHEDYPPRCWTPDFCLWFRVAKEYQEGLCTDRGDAYVVAMLYYAMVTGSDIFSKAPVSVDLLYHLNHYLIPTLCNDKSGFKRIKVIADPIAEPYPTKGFIGTGMSCGVDSFFSLLKHSGAEVFDEYRLTHLTYLNMGSIFHPDNIARGGSLEEFNSSAEDLYKEKLNNAREVSESCGLPLVYIESNLDTDIYRGGYGYTAVYRNCALILATQGLWGKYICSTAGWPLEFYEPTLKAGSEHYETLLFTCFSNNTVTFIAGGGECTRIDKTRWLADFPLSQDYLDVCFKFRNCGRCSKCYRTLLTLDVFDKLDNFSKVFDIDNFNTLRDFKTESLLKHKSFAYAWLLEVRKTDPFARDIYSVAKQKGKVRFGYNLLRIFWSSRLVRIIYSKISKPHNVSRRSVR